MHVIASVEGMTDQGAWIASVLERRDNTVTRLTHKSACTALETPADLWLIDGNPCEAALELVSRLRRLGSTHQLPILFIAAHDTEDSVMRAYAAGANTVLTPPLSRAQLIVQVKRMLQARATKPATPKPLELVVGDVYANRYRIERRIGEGGNAVVFEALDEQSAQRVALKIADGKSSDLPESRQRLQREAYALMAIDCAHTPQILEVGRHEGREFMSLELIEGQNLWERVKQRGPLNADEAYNLLMGLALALSSVEHENFVHRDLKPGNVILRDDQAAWPVLVDFGLARSPAQDFLTDPDVLVGTAGYMAPEYVLGNGLDCRSDLFSLGHVVCFAVTGHQAWPDERGFKLLSRMTRETYKVPTSMPEPLRGILQSLVQVEPDNRPANAHALMNLLTATPWEPTAPDPVKFPACSLVAATEQKETQ